jgi:hypothetical protein
VHPCVDQEGLTGSLLTLMSYERILVVCSCSLDLRSARVDRVLSAMGLSYSFSYVRIAIRS